MSKILISVVVPVHNEEANLPVLFERIYSVFDKLPHYTLELIIVDDGSRDHSVAVAQSLNKPDNKVQIVELVRNFGKEIATTAGLHHTHGEAAIVIDADLQHPVKLIPEFLEQWQAGADVVVGVRVMGKGHTSFLKRLGSRGFYRLMSLISDTVIVPNATDFRLIDRVVIDQFNRFTERNRITRGLIDWLGFTHAYIYFEPERRMFGNPAYTYLKLVKLAINSLISMSFIPLKMAGYLGIIITLVSGPIGLFIFFEKYLLRDPWHMSITGSATLGVILMFLVGIILICLGLITLYIANIYGEVANRPLYVERHRRDRPQAKDDPLK